MDLRAARIENLPLFLSAEETFLLPSVSSSSLDARLLNFQHSRVACPGAKIKATGSVNADIKCLDDNQIGLIPDDPGVSGRIVSFKELDCTRSIRERVQETDAACGPGGQGLYAHIGWYPESRSHSQFHRQITVCHDKVKEHTYFANHTLYGSAIDARNSEAERPGHFKEGPFYDKSAADASYKLRNQKHTLKIHLGEETGEKVFDQRASLFLAKGHLSPDADFIYKEWQDATYYFANVAPQWQAFNNGNWKYIEQAVRSYAKGSDARIDVYTGTLGTLKLEDDDGVGRKLFLGRTLTEENSDKPIKDSSAEEFDLIPVPEFYWKIAHDPVQDRAIVFIGLNNPFFQGDPEREATICPDICAEAKWFFLSQKDVGKGYMYCCSYFDFKGVIDWVPELSLIHI